MGIIALYVPDFIAFRPAKSIEIKKLEVFLVDGTKSFKAYKVSAEPIKIEDDDDGNKIGVFYDETEIRAMNFNIPSTEHFFKAKKIKFVADGKNMYYNLEKSEWELDTDEK